jgi:hypothetical protein
MSEQQVRGVVDRTFTKVKSTRAGDKTIHYAVVDGFEFSTAFKQPFTEGEMIDVAVKFNYGEHQLVPGKTGAGLPPAGSTPAPIKGNFPKSGGSNYGNKGKFPVDPKDGQMSIIRQSSMDRAVTLIRDMVACGTMEAPATVEDYLKLCIEIALNITDYASGNDIMQLNAVKELAKGAING